MTVKVSLKRDLESCLQKTSVNTAMQVVAFDTILQNGGSASRKLIFSEIDRRLIHPLGDKMANKLYSGNQLSAISTVLSSERNWITCAGGVWTMNDGAYCKMLTHFESAPRNFGFESADELLDLLDQHTDRYDPDKPICGKVNQLIEENQEVIDQVAAAQKRLPKTLEEAIERGLLTESPPPVEDPKPEFDLDADKQYRIDDIMALRKELNEGIDQAIKNVMNSTSLETLHQSHKSLLNGISWAVKEEYDQQLDRMTAQCKQMYK